VTDRVVDARGETLPGRPVRRVVSLVPSLTASVCDLGAGERLVGRTAYCVEPPPVRAVPACGGTKNPDPVAILSLRPDMVLAAREENRPEDVAALEAAGLPVYVTDPVTLDDADRLLRDLGLLLGATGAAERYRRELAAVRADLADRRRGRDPVPAAVLVWREPWRAVGGGTYADAVMAAACLRNVLADRPRYPETDLEELRRRRPRLVLLPDEPYRFRERHAAELAAAGAVADESRAVPVPGWALFWYGTRSAAGLRLVAALAGS